MSLKRPSSKIESSKKKHKKPGLLDKADKLVSEWDIVDGNKNLKSAIEETLGNNLKYQALYDPSYEIWTEMPWEGIVPDIHKKKFYSASEDKKDEYLQIITCSLGVSEETKEVLESIASILDRADELKHRASELANGELIECVRRQIIAQIKK